MVTATAPDPISTTFGALADPTRRAILARLASGEASVTELAEPFEMSLPAVSKHLKVLERAGLIARGREAQWRPCRLEAAPLKDVADWVERYRQNWEESFDRLDEYLKELQDKGKEVQPQDHEEGGQEWPKELTPRQKRPSGSLSSPGSSMPRASWSGRHGPTASSLCSGLAPEVSRRWILTWTLARAANGV